jgi:HPt (histidine-containing phosphotransfer) domain-containing protein
VLASHVPSPQPRPTIDAADAPVLQLPPEPVSAPELPPGQVLMDWRRLAQFREFDDKNLTMTQEVVALFIREMPRRMSDISLALTAGDSGVLSRAAHALKGAASNMGAQALGNACATLEQSSRSGEWPADAAAQVARIGALTEQTHQVLSDWQAERVAAAQPATVPEPGVHA